MESTGPCAVITPAAYDDSNFRGVGEGSSLTPLLTGNVSEETVDWDYRYPSRLGTKSKESMLTEVRE